jgi:hypothetical protein
VVVMMGVARASRRSHRGKGNSRRQQQRRENILHHFSLLGKISSPRGGLQTYSILGQPVYERGLKRECVAGAWVTCRNPGCLRSTPVTFEAIGVAPETPFPAIAAAGRSFARRAARDASTCRRTGASTGRGDGAVIGSGTKGSEIIAKGFAARRNRL